MTDQPFQHHGEGAEHADAPPWKRPAEPDHPMIVEGGVVDGNTELMFRCMVEEYLLAGHSPQAILAMCDQPNYQAFHASMHSLGRARAESIITEAAARVGCHRSQFSESNGTAKPATLTIGASACSSTE